MTSPREAVFIVDQEWAIVYANSTAPKLFRVSNASLLKSSIFNLMPTRIRAGQQKLWSSAPDDGESLRVDTLGMRGSEEFPLKVELARIPGAALLCATLRTPATNGAKKNRQSQKMEALGLLAGGVAHDFNNSLTAIIGFTESVIQELHAQPHLADDLKEVLAAAREAGDLTKQLLSFARKRPVESAVIELNGAVAEIENLVRRTLPSSIDFEVVPSKADLHVRLASTELHQIIINLATNARHAMPNGGNLRIELSRELGLESQLSSDTFANVTVSDSGAGIPEEVLAKIFDPFFSTKGEEGTGLGLSTCFGIASQAGGSLSVTSNVGEGTSFVLRIPTTHMIPVRSLTTTQRVDVRRHQGFALVVEDQPAIRKYISRVLSSSGLDVQVASSAEEAVTIFKALSSPLDLLVTDSMLPGKSGQDLAKELREHDPGLRVVLISGHLSPGADPASVFETSMSFVAKPFTAIQLRRAVDNLLDPPRQLSGKILLVGPSEETAAKARQLLRDVGHEITVLPSAESALEFLRKNDEASSLMLLEISLPGLSALELLRSAGTAPMAHDLPVILLVDSVSQGLPLPPNCTASRLCKPLTREKLSGALAQLGLELS